MGASQSPITSLSAFGVLSKKSLNCLNKNPSIFFQRIQKLYQNQTVLKNDIFHTFRGKNINNDVAEWPSLPTRKAIKTPAEKTIHCPNKNQKIFFD